LSLGGIPTSKNIKSHINNPLKRFHLEESGSILDTSNPGNQSALVGQQIKPNINNPLKNIKSFLANNDPLRQSTLAEIRSFLAQIMPILEYYQKNQESKEKIQLFLKTLPLLKNLKDLTMYQGTYELFHIIFLRVLIENLLCLIDQESSIESEEILNSLMFFKENLDNFEKKPIDVGLIPMALHYSLHFLNYPKDTKRAHLKRIKYSTLNFFFKPTPKKFENGESGLVGKTI